MRTEFVEALVAEADFDERILLLTGDLGFNALEPFARCFPNRFFNVGVAEQNMAGISTGLAEAGFVPFLYSIATFASMRPYEFIRNGPIFHELPVRVVGMGGGLDYGTNGLTHYALEDVALMRTQPELTVLVPADGDQARAAVRATRMIGGPLYLRLEKGGPPVPGLGGRFELGRAQVIGAGDDVALIAMGGIAHEAVKAAELLAEQGVAATVVVVSTLHPAPIADLVGVLRRVRLALTLEAHYLAGGVGSLVCEVVAEHDIDCRVVRCGVSRVPRGETGSRASLYELHGLSGQRIAETTAAAIASDPRPAKVGVDS
jgi:transketolase